LKDRKATLVFISHSLDAVKNLCTRTIWLEHGQIMMDGPTELVVAAYEQSKVADGSPAGAAS
jgi:ABC-type polysaccharide/polyol phosphate transport system ATPase subunit